jgi:hypothetical protein
MTTAKKVKPKAKKTFLYCETSQYDRYKKLEDNCFEILKDLQQKSDASLGINKITDYAKMLENVAEYFIQTYWECWGKLSFPPHTNREHLFETNSRITVASLDELQQRFNTNMEAMKQYKPDVTKEGLISNLKESMFDKFLCDSKRDKYEAIQKFIEASKELKKYGASGEIHLQRYCTDLITDDNSNLTVNHYNFIGR